MAFKMNKWSAFTARPEEEPPKREDYANALEYRKAVIKYRESQKSPAPPLTKSSFKQVEPTSIISVKGEKEGEVPRKIKSEHEGKIYKEKRKKYKDVDVLKEKVREKGKIFGTKKYYKTDAKGNILIDSKGNPIETTKKEIRQS